MAVHAPPCAPPDPNPKKPTLAAPAGTCDTHAHVFGPQSRYAYSPARGYTPPDAPYEAYRALHAALGVERGVLTQPSVYGTDNTAMLDAVARDPENLRAVAAVGADVTDAALQRLHDAGARGIRVNLVDKGGMPFDTFADVEKFAARIVPMGWHIEYLVHVHDFPDLEVLGRLPADSVIGHFGYMHVSNGVDHPGFRSFLRLFEKGRVWVKMTAPYRITARETLPYDDVEPVAKALREARPDRLLWGSDWPHPICPKPMPNDGGMFEHLAEWLPGAALRRQVMAENPKSLYGF
jgi:2-pyrone-4,6-dicarboxylate lactonase